MNEAVWIQTWEIEGKDWADVDQKQTQAVSEVLHGHGPGPVHENTWEPFATETLHFSHVAGEIRVTVRVSFRPRKRA